MPEVYAAHQAVAAGAPAALFTGITVAGYRVSERSKLHDHKYCPAASGAADRLRQTTVPLLSLTAKNICRCMTLSDLPQQARPLLTAVDAVRAIIRATATTKESLSRGEAPDLAQLAVIRAADRSRLTDEVGAFRATSKPAATSGDRWVASVLRSARQLLAAAEATVGDDRARELRHATAALTGRLSGRFDRTKHLALNTAGGMQRGIATNADAVLKQGLQAGQHPAQLRAAVLALVDGAQPATLEQVPDQPAPAGLGARAGAIAVWRTAAAAELDQMVTAALADAARHAAGTGDGLLILETRHLPEDLRGLLGTRQSLAARGDLTAYLVPDVIGLALHDAMYGAVHLSAGRLPDDVPAVDVADVVLQLIAEQDLAGDDALTAAAGILTRQPELLAA